MGMAASQARYLALVARKSNCEFEGQQINQARTALSNQSANLFNQMLGLKVPVPPSTQDFTKVQYSFKDGANTSTISDWEQLSSADPDYNYVVTHYYYTDQYTGSQKLMNDPQVQFTPDAVSILEINKLREEVETAEKFLADARETNDNNKKTYDNCRKEINNLKTEAKNIENYANSPLLEVSSIEHDEEPENQYTINGSEVYTSFGSLTERQQESVSELIDAMVDSLALNSKYKDDKSELYFNFTGSGECSFAFGEDLKNLLNSGGEGSLSTYNPSIVSGYQDEIASLEQDAERYLAIYEVSTKEVKAKEEALNAEVEEYESLQHPEYIGNSELTPIASLSKEQEAEIRQIVSDMEEEGITSEITNYFDPESGAYFGGIYSFKMGGKTYFTTYADLEASYNSGTGINNIDGQNKLAYYNATYVSTKVEKTEKALLETDGAGRFTSVRFEDDSITYALTTETVTDEAAYQDAMNQYYYENAKYDKMVQDINAKTSIIHHEDQQLELRLKQLDTEQSALSTEMEAVKKVVDDNIDSSFKTFGG